MRLILAFFLALAGPVARASESFAFERTPGALPKDVVPKHYALTITPDAEAGTFEGTMTVRLEARATTRVLVLHANQLEITKAILLRENRPLTPRPGPAPQTIALDLPAAFPAGTTAELRLEWKGKINPGSFGLFRDRYQVADGEKTLLATQCEPTSARRIVPCWDEPAFRAAWELTLIVPQDWTAAANMPAASSLKLAGTGKREWIFRATPPMPSYLFAFAAGELESEEDEWEGVKLRVLCTPGKRPLARYALDSTKRLLAYYNEYFGFRYPLPKLDQIALPTSFNGAMENWGLITYGENRLLFDPATSTEAARENVFAILAHEIAHQWFGNLVTMAWWDDLWLNEGFASWMGTKATAELNPAWQTWPRTHRDKEKVLPQDARPTSHPVQTPVRSEWEAGAQFDDITYVKGEQFLRMLEDYLGPGDFRQALRAYMRRHQYANAATADLWSALEEASGKPVPELAAAWTEQPGFPQIGFDWRQRTETIELILTQQRFTLNDPNPRPLRWKVPVSFDFVPARDAPAGRPQTVLLANERGEFPASIPVITEGHVFPKLNAGDHGYYRVRYTEDQRRQLLPRLARLAPADKLNVLGDLWAMVEAGQMPVGDFLGALEMLRLEASAVAWEGMMDFLRDLDRLQAGDAPGRARFRAWAVELLRAPWERVAWRPRAGEDRNDALLRAQLIETLGRFGDEGVRTGARERLALWKENPAALPPDVRDAVLREAGRGADAATWEWLLQQALAATRTDDRRRWFDALQHAEDPALARRAAELTTSGAMRGIERQRNLARLAEAGEHWALAWEWFRAHQSALLADVPPTSRPGVAAAILAGSTDPTLAEALLAHHREATPEFPPREAEKAALVIRHRAALGERLRPEVAAWLTARLPSAGAR